MPVTLISYNLLTSLSCFIDYSDAGCWGSEAFFPAPVTTKYKQAPW